MRGKRLHKQSIGIVEHGLGRKDMVRNVGSGKGLKNHNLIITRFWHQYWECKTESLEAIIKQVIKISNF